MNLFKRPAVVPSNPTRKVLLLATTGDMKIVDALPCDAGWVARYYDNDDSWCLLEKGGAVVGKTYVARWFPYAGWPTEAKESKESKEPNG